MNQPPIPSEQPQQPPLPQQNTEPQLPRYAPPPQYAQPQYVQPQYAQPQYTQPYATQGYASYALPAQPGPGGLYDGAAAPGVLTRPLYGATFGQAIRRAFLNYATFRGRASRSEFWYFTLFHSLIVYAPVIVLSVLDGSFNSYIYSSDSYSAASEAREATESIIVGVGVFVFVGMLGTFIPMLATTWRRLHDSNLAGPLFFLAFVPYGFIAVIVLTILPSKPLGRRFDLR